MTDEDPVVKRQKEEIATLKKTIATYKRHASNRLGDGYWGLTKESENFTHEEIVFLFARIYSRIGFDSVQKVQTHYPDVVAIEQGVEKQIELEPVLSSFQHHIPDDDLSMCDYVVCWKVDDHPKISEIKRILHENNIQVIELKEHYQKTKVKRKKPRSPVYSEKDILNLGRDQLRLLSMFVLYNQTFLGRRFLKEELHVRWPVLAGIMSAFSQQATHKEFLVRKHPGKGEDIYEFNEKYRPLVEKVLREYDFL